MTDDEPCCAAAAARKIRKVLIGSQEIGIAQLDEIMTKVSAMGLDGDVLGRALLREVKIYNFVPRSKEKEYEIAMVKEYCRRRANGN
jgi:hypothetical protein